MVHMSTLQNKTEMTQDIALKFCRACEWAYETWVTHKYLFDLNTNTTGILRKAASFSNRLSIITQEYALQQIAKLHDPAVQNNSLNVSIDLVVRFGEWGDREAEIKAITTRLSEFWGHVSTARNKLLAHNDLKTILADESLGGFPEGEDDQYFSALQELVNAVSAKWSDSPVYPFNDLAIADVHEFLNMLNTKG